MKINLIEYFEQTAERYPNKTAVIDKDGGLNFGQVQRLGKSLASRIYESTCVTNSPVALFLPKSSLAIVSVIGTLYSGNIYVPLDINNPTNRIQGILENLSPSCIVSDSARIPQLEPLNLKIPVINIDEIHSKDPQEGFLGYPECIDTDPAYIIHTSGSTGLPKGVAISHRSIMDYIHWAIDTFEITHEEHIGNQAPLVFDNSTLDIYLMIFTGATLNLIPESLFMFPAKLMEYIESKNINFVFWVPSVLVNVANLKILESLKVSSLKKVLFAGEVMPTKQLNNWISHLEKDVLFANLYGPTEITVDCTFHIVDRNYDDHEVLPIGKACRNSDVLILNDNNQKCGICEQGELCVRGSSLALGYWNNFEKTDAAFVQNPLNSSFPEKIYRTGDLVYLNERKEIIFVGRKDNQIKHLGYRIELGEIEHAIASTFDGLIPCVLYEERNKKIILIYEAKEVISPGEFRKNLSKVLSKYMLPSEYIKIDKIPLNSSGKIDRTNLKKKYASL
jgi:amino acid adenylation domain-containing protein